jgi:hypothetical protein
MKSLYLIAICLILSQGIHTQFLLAKPLVRFQAQATCQGEVSEFLTKFQAFMTKVSGGDFSTLISDVNELVAIVKVVYSTCIPHTLLAVGDQCSGDISKLIAIIPTVQAHLAAKNYIALIADFSNIKTVVDDFAAHCVNQSAACVAQIATLEADGKSTLQHLAELDQTSLHKDVYTVINEIFAYKDACIGLQGMAKLAFVASAAAVQASTVVAGHLMNGTLVQTDACQADIATVVAEVPKVEAEIKSSNIFGLLSSYGTISTAVKHFIGSCIVKSDACTSAQTGIVTSATQFAKDFVAENKAGCHDGADSLIDQVFVWYGKCVSAPAA